MTYTLPLKALTHQPLLHIRLEREDQRLTQRQGWSLLRPALGTESIVVSKTMEACYECTEQVSCVLTWSGHPATL